MTEEANKKRGMERVEEGVEESKERGRWGEETEEGSR